jgi:hypothetical protein
LRHGPQGHSGVTKLTLALHRVQTPRRVPPGMGLLSHQDLVRVSAAASWGRW